VNNASIISVGLLHGKVRLNTKAVSRTGSLSPVLDHPNELVTLGLGTRSINLGILILQRAKQRVNVSPGAAS
jgi:hypothetical protein